VVVGSINADLVVSVSRLPGAGETVTGGTFARHGGGKGANQAVAAARLGARVAFVGAVGADDLGAEALRELEAEGIDVSAVARLGDAATGVAAIVVDEHGENQIAVASGANARVGGDTIPRLTGTGVVLLGHEVPEAAVVAGIEAARAAGWTAVLNPAPARPLPDDVEGVILTPNAGEARVLVGAANDRAAVGAADDRRATGAADDGGAAGAADAARALAARTGAPVLITLGARGAILFAGDAATHLEATPVEVVDTTGAGDTVNGALAAELAAGRRIHQAAQIAVHAAALSTRRPGARAGMPRRDELTA